MEIWFWFWVLLAAILIVMEIFTSGFFMLPFGVGAAVAALLQFLGVDIRWQWIAFIGVSAALLVGLRRFADTVSPDSPIKVGSDRLLGCDGFVIETIDRQEGTGRVRVGSEEWRAEASGNRPLPARTPIVVDRVEGTRLIVHPRPVDETMTDTGKEASDG